MPAETGSLSIISGNTKQISSINGDIYLILLEDAYEIGESFMITSSVTVNVNHKGYYLEKHKAIIVEGDCSDISPLTTLVIPNYY